MKCSATSVSRKVLTVINHHSLKLDKTTKQIGCHLHTNSCQGNGGLSRAQLKCLLHGTVNCRCLQHQHQHQYKQIVNNFRRTFIAASRSSTDKDDNDEDEIDFDEDIDPNFEVDKADLKYDAEEAKSTTPASTNVLQSSRTEEIEIPTKFKIKPIIQSSKWCWLCGSKGHYFLGCDKALENIPEYIDTWNRLSVLPKGTDEAPFLAEMFAAGYRPLQGTIDSVATNAAFENMKTTPSKKFA